MNRAEARRRSREMTRAELVAADGQIDDYSEVTETAETTPRRTRSSMLKLPDFRGDIAALPSMFRTRRLLWLPFVLLLAGFIDALVFPGLPLEMQQIAFLYIQYFLVPQALFTYFIGGFLAPRASYLVGLLLGVVNGLLWIVIFTLGASMGLGLGAFAGVDVSRDGIGAFSTAVILGTFAAGFAGWYRDFLRQMQERGKTRRADQEVKARELRRAERQETRRSSRQRPT
jgi:hypothetical protein